jgi:Dolichyl-phosphate-mannose-protein mannosyltransferase
MNPKTYGSSIKPPAGQVWFAAACIFLVAFGVRVLMLHDSQVEARKVQSGVAADYQRTSQLLRQHRFRGFFDPNGPLADPDLLGHPPGYPIVRTLLGVVFYDSNRVIQLFQIACDAIAAVIVFLIALELLSFPTAAMSGVLVALAPQFVWNSVLLLPDTLAVLPLLFAILLLSRAVRKPRLITFLAVGLLIGVSCWFRANALLLAPFVAVAAAVLLRPNERIRYAATIVLSAFLVVGVLTARNWFVYHHFIPVSLGAGQTLLEGIADYDPGKRFGIPETDMGIMKMEADELDRPDYYSSLFSPDGVQRERIRLARGFGIIIRNPVWFTSVMVRRAGSMLRLERARAVSSTPPMTHDTSQASHDPVRRVSPPEFFAARKEQSSGSEFLVAPDSQTVRIVTDDSKYGVQLRSSIAVKPNYDHLLRLPGRVESGRVVIDLSEPSSRRPLGSATVEKLETRDPSELPIINVEIPFASGSQDSVAIEIRNAAAQSGRSIVHVGAVELYELGPATFLWTRYPRLIIATLQRVFITAVMLPLVILGIAVLVRQRMWRVLILLLVIPTYYMCIQSLLHTEYRYVLAIHYFLFVFVGVALEWAYTSLTLVLRKKFGTNLSEAII